MMAFLFQLFSISAVFTICNTFFLCAVLISGIDSHVIFCHLVFSNQLTIVMETLIIKPNIDKNGKNRKIILGIVIFLGVLIGMLSFDMLQPSRIQFIDKTRESNE